MDIDIVNAVLRLCSEQQTCLFEVPLLCDFCLDQRLCTNSKHVLASIRNYMEIFKISRDQNRIEFFMPFEICRNHPLDGSCQTNGEGCSNLHVCYDYFYTNTCRRLMHCPHSHLLTERCHGHILGQLSNLDLDALTKAFRFYCQSKKHLLNHTSAGVPSSRGLQPTPLTSLINNPTVAATSSSSPANAWRLVSAPQISPNASWKTNHRTIGTAKPPPAQPNLHYTPGKGLQICWTPLRDIQAHFIEVVFSNQGKCDGGPIRMHTVYQHLGIAQLFYQNSNVVDRVIRHGPVPFQSFTFSTRLLQRTVDMRRLCFLNVSMDSSRIPLYIDTVSMPYKTNHFEFYQDDQQTVLVEYKEDIDFSKISSNIRSHPECGGLPIKCIQLHHPETLLIEYDHEYSEDDIKNLLKNERIFHIKTYTTCAFVHFYCYDDLRRSIKTSPTSPVRMTPIYIDIYSQRHLDSYLQRRQMELETKVAPILNVSVPSTNGDVEEEEEEEEKEEPFETLDLLPVANEQTEVPTEPEPVVVKEQISPPKPVEIDVANVDDPPSDTDENNNDIVEIEIQSSDDDFHDLPSEFDDDDIFLDDSIDNNSDMEFLRNAAKNLMSSLAEMEAASHTNTNTPEAPHPLLYGDDYVVTIKSRRFALAFLDYTQFRVEKHRNPDKFRLLASLKKQTAGNHTNSKKRKDTKQRDDTPSPTMDIEPDLLAAIETKSSKKKRNRRNKKRKTVNQDKPEPAPESTNDVEDDEENESSQIPDNQGNAEVDFPQQRLPHVYLDDDLRPCIVVAGEEHHDENGHDMNDHDGWHNIVAGGKPVPVSKRSKKRKQQQQPKEEKSLVETNDQHLPQTPAPAAPNLRSQPSVTDNNSIIIPINCRGFLRQAKSYETFRLRLRRSFLSINVHFHLDTYTIIVDGNVKANAQNCLQYLQALQSRKHAVRIAFGGFPQTTVTNIIRMQQSTAQVKLVHRADYQRIFRSTYRLIDYQLKQQYNQQQCIYCRRSKKKFQITYLEFPGEKQSIAEINDAIQQRVLQLLNTRFTYIAIAFSADLMTTKRWATFYKSLTEHKDMNKTLLIRKINTIVQVYGLHAHVQQIQTLITKFLDVNRYETDVIETEQASGMYSLFQQDFHDMKNLDIFREAELRFVHHQRNVLLFQCFQEKFETVKSHIENLRTQLSTILLPVKSPILSRYYSKSNELQRIAAASSCIITIEKRVDQNRQNDHFIELKITGRSSENTAKAQRLLKDFEEHKYSSRRINNNDIRLLNEQDVQLLQTECSTCNVSCTIDPTNNAIDLEGLSGDFIQIEKIINDLCLIAARRALDDLLYSVQWIYYDASTNKPVAFGEIIKQQLEACHARKQRGIVNLKDHTGHIRKFDLDQMVEIIHENHSKVPPTHVKIERRDFKNPQPVQLPTHWAPMTEPWQRILAGRRDNVAEWRANAEIQRLLKLPHMLPEPWLIEIHRVQNPRMFQQYVAHRENLATRSQATERILYRLAQINLIDDMCAHGFNRSHTDSAFNAYGHGCHFYCKAIDIDRTATLLAHNQQTTPIHLQQQQTPMKPPVRFLFVCKVLVGRYTRGDASMKTCPPGYDSLVDNVQSPEIFVTYQDAQVLPEYLIAYQSAIF